MTRLQHKKDNNLYKDYLFIPLGHSQNIFKLDFHKLNCMSLYLFCTATLSKSKLKISWALMFVVWAQGLRIKTT